jgi:hypothetical protein
MFVSNLGTVNSTQMMRENLPLDLKKRTGGQVTPLFRSLFFLYDNGMTSLNSLSLI